MTFLVKTLRKKAFYSNYQRKEMFLTVQIGEESNYFL
jgi:hypothetical protein